MNRSFIALLLAALAMAPICGCRNPFRFAPDPGLPQSYVSGGLVTDSRWRGAPESYGRGAGIHLSGFLNPLYLTVLPLYWLLPQPNEEYVSDRRVSHQHADERDHEPLFPHYRVAIGKVDTICSPDIQVSLIEYDSGNEWRDLKIGVGVASDGRRGVGVRGNLGLFMGSFYSWEEVGKNSAWGPYAGVILELRFVLPHRFTHSLGAGIDYAVAFNRNYRRGYFGTKQDVLLAYRMAW